MSNGGPFPQPPDGWRLLVAAMARPVRARLRPVPANRHRAPRRRAVLRAVVERPLARVLATCLEAGPGALGDRAKDDREQLPQRPLGTLARRLQQGAPVRIESNEQVR